MHVEDSLAGKQGEETRRANLPPGGPVMIRPDTLFCDVHNHQF